MKTTTRTALTLAMAAVAAVGLTACGSSTATESSLTPAASAPVSTSAAPAPDAPVPAAPVPSTCPEFAMTAAHMSTYWTYLNINLGTTNDEAPTLANLSSGIAAMQDLAPTCAPEAVDSIDAFAATVAAIQPIYTTQPTGADVQKVNDALTAMQQAGITMFADLGQSDYAWK